MISGDHFQFFVKITEANIAFSFIKLL